MSLTIFQPFPTPGAIWDQYGGAAKQDLPDPEGITGEEGMDEVGIDGSILDIPLPPPRPISLGGRISNGAMTAYDFQSSTYVRQGAPQIIRTTSKWVLKQTFTPPAGGFVSGQQARLREIAAHCAAMGMDLQYVFTALNVESRYARLNRSKNGTYIGPFQYGHPAMKAAMLSLKPKRYTFNRWSLLDQCIAKDADCKRFTQMLKRRFGESFDVKPWHMYLLHQQGPGGGPALLSARMNNPNQNVVQFVRSVKGMSVAAVTGQAKELLRGFSAYLISVNTWLTLFEEFWNKCRDGTGGRQPTTDYIELDGGIEVGTGGTNYIDVSTVIDPDKGDALDVVDDFGLLENGDGIDLSMAYESQEPTCLFIGDIRYSLFKPGRIIIIDFWWDEEDRGNELQPTITTVFSVSGEGLGSLTVMSGWTEDTTPVTETPEYSEVDFENVTPTNFLKVVSCAGDFDYNRDGTCYAICPEVEATHRVWARSMNYARGGWPGGSENTVEAYIASTGGMSPILPVGQTLVGFVNGPTYTMVSSGGDARTTLHAKLGVFQSNEDGSVLRTIAGFNPEDGSGGMDCTWGQDHRLVIRNGINSLKVCLDSEGVLEAVGTFTPDGLAGGAGSVTVSARGKVAIRRIITMPDDPSNEMLFHLGRKDLRVGTEPDEPEE